MKNQVTKEALLNYFAGRATALQKQAIDEWAKIDNNKEAFFEVLAMWESQNLQFVSDSNEGLKRHRQRITDHQQQPQAEEYSETKTGWLGQSRFRWMMAASVGVLFLISSVIFKDNLLFITYRTVYGETKTIYLSDGSLITLNANSSLRVPRFGFGKETRNVVLLGEADFSIKHMVDNQQFLVQTDKNFEVVVLGTEFLVNTREKGTKVVLNKGKVRLRYLEGETSKQLTMKPGNLVTFDQNGHINVQQTNKPTDYTSWKEHRFVFEGTTLAEIRTLFADNYGIDLQIPDKSLTQETISGAFTAYSAEELIETLASASNLTYRQQGKTIVITENH